MNSKNVTKPVSFRSMSHRQLMITFSAVLLALFLGSLDQTIVGTAMPRIISDLGGFNFYTWVTTAYVVSSAVMISITGKLTDMYGRKWFYIGGLGIFVIGSLLCGLSKSMTEIIIFRTFQGLGAGIMMANAWIVIGDLFSPAERGKYQGYTSGVFGLSAIIGPLLGGFITDTISWHWIFFINIPLGILVIILFIRYFPDIQVEKSKSKIDYPGLVILILAIVSVMLAFSLADVEYRWFSPQIIGMLVFAVLMIILFIIIENRSKEPIIPLSIFKNRIMAISAIVVFLTGIAMFCGTLFIPLFYQGVLGSTATISGSFLTPMLLGQIFASFISGQLLSRAGGHYKLLGAIGAAIMAIGYFLLSTMTLGTSYAVAATFIIITGFGLGITLPLYTIAVQNAVPYKQLGVVTSMIIFCRSLGGAIGLAVLGSFMNNKFASIFMTQIPVAAKEMIPAESLKQMASNPQELVSPDAQAQLQAIFRQMGEQGSSLFQEVLRLMRQALSSVISEVFLIVFFILVLTFIINLFLKELPLRSQHEINIKEERKSNFS